MPIEKRWVVKPQGDSEAVAKLAAVLRISPVLANLLVQRGIDTVEKADKFFKPSLADLHDPFLMKDMDKAVERVEQAVRNNEKIMVYGDYDVDGCTAVALVYKFLRQIGHKNLMFYIPDRYTEGYGISVKGIDLAARKGVRSYHRPGLRHQSHGKGSLCKDARAWISSSATITSRPRKFPVP